MLQWIDIFEAQLSEAKWFSEGYVPTQEQYLRNGVTTGGTYMALVHAFCLMGQGVTKETLAMMEPYPNLFSCSGKILRLWDDLGTARVCDLSINLIQYVLSINTFVLEKKNFFFSFLPLYRRSKREEMLHLV